MIAHPVTLHRSAMHIQKWVKGRKIRKKTRILYEVGVIQAGNIFVSISI